jgi:hypothetical protein
LAHAVAHLQPHRRAPRTIDPPAVALVELDQRTQQHRRRRVRNSVHLIDDLDQLLVRMLSEHCHHHTKRV